MTIEKLYIIVIAISVIDVILSAYLKSHDPTKAIKDKEKVRFENLCKGFGM